ncbi:hypothetical protein COD94_03645 [Bacillus cereus]|nr:hypothetical protein COD94_03645 [Bacillus cereus]
MLLMICNPTFDVKKDVGMGVCVSSFFCYNERMHKRERETRLAFVNRCSRRISKILIKTNCFFEQGYRYD